MEDTQVTTSRASEVAYYYPAPYWHDGEGDWIKSLLLFFDRVAILLPGYMYGIHRTVDPSLAGPLEDLGLLEVLEPAAWIGQNVADRSFTASHERELVTWSRPAAWCVKTTTA